MFDRSARTLFNPDNTEQPRVQKGSHAVKHGVYLATDLLSGAAHSASSSQKWREVPEAGVLAEQLRLPLISNCMRWRAPVIDLFHFK